MQRKWRGFIAGFLVVFGLFLLFGGQKLLLHQKPQQATAVGSYQEELKEVAEDGTTTEDSGWKADPTVVLLDLKDETWIIQTACYVMPNGKAPAMYFSDKPKKGLPPLEEDETYLVTAGMNLNEDNGFIRFYPTQNGEYVRWTIVTKEVGQLISKTIEAVVGCDGEIFKREPDSPSSPL